ncbi:transferase [Kockovaella imperatae]|uniref:Transferase n=1 Tax=Kockovaella imperatae TaxID=4999 RepID=A0A1Y1U5J2_9TREE|nr:transferase [Kockovaella imperatae]ORX33299.1 transferase [Kockovaella imperatae]
MIEVLSTESPCPARTRSLHDPFPLGTLDVLVPIVIPVAVVFVYRTPVDPQILRDALARLLEVYPQLTGRLQEDTLGNRFITSIGSGVLFETARCSDGLPEKVTMVDLPGEGNDLFASFTPDATAVSNGPILSIRHTSFACDSVSLGIRCLHTVCDAVGFFQLVRDLAQVYRNLRDDKQALDGVDLPTIIPLKAPPGGSTTLFTLTPLTPQPTASDPATGRFFHYTPDQLDSIKRRTSVGTFSALCAHLHCRIYQARARVYDALSPPDLLTPVDLRRRYPFPPRYFPQAVLTTWAEFEPDHLLQDHVSRVASTVHHMARHPDATSRIDQTLGWIESQPDKRSIASSFRYGNGSLMLSQWNKMDMYAVFENRPVLVSTPFTSVSCIDGLGYFLPALDGGIDVCLSLSEPVWKYIDMHL